MANPAAGLAAHGLAADGLLANRLTTDGLTANGLATHNLWFGSAGKGSQQLVQGELWASEHRPAHALPDELDPPPPPQLKPVVATQGLGLAPDTPMQKVVLPGLVDLILGNVVVPGRFDPYRIAGLVTRLHDVPPGSSVELARRYGLNQIADWPVTDDLHVLRFYAHSPELYVAPFERSVFFQVDLLELPANAELWRIDVDGGEHRLGAYLNRQVGWVSTAPVVLGPRCWSQPPVPLCPTVRRGLLATYRGYDFDADFGPRPGEVTLHPQPGKRAPQYFTERSGVCTLAVPIYALDALEWISWRGWWRGLPVELVEIGQHGPVIHYIVENGKRAAEFGLAEVDYRVWRGTVPHSEVSDVQRQRVVLHAAVQG